MNELTALGLRPSVLQELLEQGGNTESKPPDKRESALVPEGEDSHESPSKNFSFPKVVYEFSSSSNSIEPRVRLRVIRDQSESLSLPPGRESRLNLEDSDASSIGGSLEDAASYTQISSPK